MHRKSDPKVIMNHQKPVARIGFDLINTSLTGIAACISSRITTVIQVIRPSNKL